MYQAIPPETASNEPFTLVTGLQGTIQSNQHPSESGNMEQVTLHFNRSLQQLTVALAMVQAQNLEMQKFISSLRTEMRCKSSKRRTPTQYTANWIIK